MLETNILSPLLSAQPEQPLLTLEICDIMQHRDRKCYKFQRWDKYIDVQLTIEGS